MSSPRESSALRYAAFTSTPDGGNPAGIVLAAQRLSDAAMLAIAAEIGFSETAFVVGGDPAERALTLRYFTPVAEIPFCGHATIATAVALAQRHGPGPFRFRTPAGPIVIDTTEVDGRIRAAFTSVEPWVVAMPAGILVELTGLLGLTAEDLHPDYPPAISFAGNRHPILVLADQDRLDRFTFDPDLLRALMDREDWAGTVTVAVPRGPMEFESRNPFPVGTITEDPATGSAAASLGAYLRHLGRLRLPATVLIHQGRHVGRPSLLTVDIPASGGIRVSGEAVPMAAAAGAAGLTSRLRASRATGR
ncbi:PhzF family phenazine biosynthesis protein [Nakamurella multipartita]|uniref:Phenazine biosynthesis protein PhzF family n=1 Tax=Nakamurella multipartita (strain ATCC 700099 / DSM 44233 / CIP 104796 / JCM 9543 / NBRC 105858 / Y-104) TaxID=479431 RepID=C8X8S9_NAKMY|nr:PhzF family phenazine biosynthesis protein [Nakamurella multipartita]ACV79134.1 phenazine biosynthesis protein PhzF family [Nakamurella multipartita DSM 44233]